MAGKITLALDCIRNAEKHVEALYIEERGREERHRLALENPGLDDAGFWRCPFCGCHGNSKRRDCCPAHKTFVATVRGENPDEFRHENAAGCVLTARSNGNCLDIDVPEGWELNYRMSEDYPGRLLFIWMVPSGDHGVW